MSYNSSVIRNGRITMGLAIIANFIPAIYVGFAYDVMPPIGVLFQMADIPSSPMILAFILAENLESYFRKGFSYTDQGVLPFFTRPVSLAFLLLAAFSVFWPMISEKRKAKKAKMHS